MCLGVPGQIIAAPDVGDDIEATLRMGQVSFAGILKEVCLAYVPDAIVGDYVIVHAGFAISKVDEGEAIRVLGWLGALPEGDA